jgi:hypothetical protein
VLLKLLEYTHLFFHQCIFLCLIISSLVRHEYRRLDSGSHCLLCIGCDSSGRIGVSLPSSFQHSPRSSGRRILIQAVRQVFISAHSSLKKPCLACLSPELIESWADVEQLSTSRSIFLGQTPPLRTATPFVHLGGDKTDDGNEQCRPREGSPSKIRRQRRAALFS